MKRNLLNMRSLREEPPMPDKRTCTNGHEWIEGDAFTVAHAPAPGCPRCGAKPIPILQPTDGTDEPFKDAVVATLPLQLELDTEDDFPRPSRTPRHSSIVRSKPGMRLAVLMGGGVMLVLVAVTVGEIFLVKSWEAQAALNQGINAGDAKKDAVLQPNAAQVKKVKVGNNVYLEIQGDQRRVLIESTVCLRRGQLEQFLTRKRTKEHEAILAADVNAKDIHTALTLAKAEPGNPVKFVPKYEPARGTVIKVLVEFQDAQKKTQRLPAQQWIRNVKTQKPLEHDWVFAGSILILDPLDNTKPPFYAANDGDVICVVNLDTAMLDLPVESTKDINDRFFEAYTERIPPLDSPVLVILEPVPAPAKNKK